MNHSVACAGRGSAGADTCQHRRPAEQQAVSQGHLLGCGVAAACQGRLDQRSSPPQALRLHLLPPIHTFRPAATSGLHPCAFHTIVNAEGLPQELAVVLNTSLLTTRILSRNDPQSSAPHILDMTEFVCVWSLYMQKCSPRPPEGGCAV